MAKKVMFSIHVGDSLGHVFRTRGVASYLLRRGYDILYSIPEKAAPYLEGFIERENIRFNDQEYSYSQLPFLESSIADSYYVHARKEYELYQRFKPDVIIGDSGLLTYTYRPQVPFLKILNRIYLELADDDMDSPFSVTEKSLIRSQAEEVINETRNRLGLARDFSYYDLVSPSVLVNGAPYFLSDLKSCYRIVGINMRLDGQQENKPNPNNCFVAFGTGLSTDRSDLVSRILELLENRFKKIYVSFGTKIEKHELYQPRNAIMKPLFDTLPPNLGVIICHGGYGMVHLGIKLGLPIIAIPFQFEHYSNSYRLEKLRIGVNIGTYNRPNFEGIFQVFGVDWNKLHAALDNLEDIRKRDGLDTDLKCHENALIEGAEDFICRNT